MRHAVQDWAGAYHSTIGDPVRYVTEGHLGDLSAVHGFETVWESVAGYIRAHPQVLELPVYGSEGRDARQAARAARARQLMADARVAFDSGDHAQALDLVDEAELTEPTHQPAPGVSFARVRTAIRAAIEQ